MGSIGNGNLKNGKTNVLKIYNENTPDQYKTLFPLPSNLSDANEIARFNFRLGKYQNIGTVSTNDVDTIKISLDSLSNNQEVVDKAKIDSLMKFSLKEIQAMQDKATVMGLPYIVHYGNTNMIMDRHHRLTALKAKGAKTARVRYLDLAKLKRR